MPCSKYRCAAVCACALSCCCCIRSSLAADEDERYRIAASADGGIWLLRTPHPEPVAALAGTRKVTDTTRPLLQVRDPLAKLRELHHQRDPLYRETAHYVMDTARQSVPMLVNMLAMQLELSGPGPLR